MSEYPATYTVKLASRPVDRTVSVPGSKSLSNRALILAALQGGGTLTNLVECDDTQVMIHSLFTLGYTVDGDCARLSVHRERGDALIPNAQAELHLENSGTSIRFLTAALSVGRGHFTLDGIARMRERPIEPLLAALRQCGVTATSRLGTGCPPVEIITEGWKHHTVTVQADISSQYLSALLLAAPFSGKATTIHVEGAVVSEPYIAMTLAQLRQFGHTVTQHTPSSYRVSPWNGVPRNIPYPIEPDASSASYFFAAAAITGGRVTVRGTSHSMLQGDIRFVQALADMGCEVCETPDGIRVIGGPLRGIDIDMNAISDTMMTLAAVACFADGPTTIRNVAHVRHKETDRIQAMAGELRKLGAGAVETGDGLTITPAAMHGTGLDTYEDHRLAMSLALVGLRVPGVVIRNPGCVAKTYPNFWSDFEALQCDSAQQ